MHISQNFCNEVNILLFSFPKFVEMDLAMDLFKLFSSSVVMCVATAHRLFLKKQEIFLIFGINCTLLYSLGNLDSTLPPCCGVPGMVYSNFMPILSVQPIECLTHTSIFIADVPDIHTLCCFSSMNKIITSFNSVFPFKNISKHDWNYHEVPATKASYSTYWLWGGTNICKKHSLLIVDLSTADFPTLAFLAFPRHNLCIF